MSESIVQPPLEAYLQEYCGSTLIGISIAFTALECLFVALRFAARRVGNIKFAMDDALIVPGLILCVAINATAIAMVQYAGVGHHFLTVFEQDPSTLVLWAKFLIIESFLYLVAVVLPKLAILSIYLRVFPTTPVRIICYILGAIMVVGSIIGLFFAGLGCRPMAYFWDKTIPGGWCVNIHELYMWASFPNIITDLVMLILPIPMVWKLRVPQHVKLGLTFTFLTGSIGLAASILRFHYFTTIDPMIDGTWASVTLMTWTIVEPGAYVIAACLPTLRPLVIKFWDHSKQTISRKSGTGVSNRASGLPQGVFGAGGDVAAADNSAETPTAGGRPASGTLALARHLKNGDDYFELVEPPTGKRSMSMSMSESDTGSLEKLRVEG